MSVLGDDYRPRLEAAADEVESTRAALAAALKRRNRIIIDAVDHGLTQKLVAGWAKIKQPHVIRILARGDDDDSVALA
jgi:hypothetical protein